MDSADDIEFLLDLEPGDVEIALSPLTSICHLPENGDLRIYLYHASFGDFLADVSRSGPFYINTLIVQETVVSKCLAKLMDPSSFRGQQPSWPAELLEETLSRIPLTETVKSALNKFSLQQFWSSSAAGPDNFAHRYARLYAILLFLDALKTNRSHSEYLTFYASHISSFEFVIKSELLKYYRDVGLTSLAVIAMVRVDETEKNMRTTVENALYTLFQLTEESIKFDKGTLFLACPVGKYLLADHYPHLVLGRPDKAPEVCLNADQQAQTALRILEFLCGYPPEPIRYQQNHTEHRCPTSHSRHGRAPGRPRYLLPHRIAARAMRVTRLGFARKRREKKHRYGIVLSSPNNEDDRVFFPYHLPSYKHRFSTQDVCTLGLLYLPKILERSSRSTELVDFILGHGKDLVYIPEETRKVIRAMHEYLDRASEDLDMVID